MKRLYEDLNPWYLIGVILLISLFLRIYRLSDIYVFNFDEEYQATYAWTLVKDFHPIWIGVSSSFLDYYLGPYFTYFTAFWLFLSSGDPMITAYIASLVGVINVAAIYWVGKEFFNRQAGIVSAALYGMLPLFVYFDQKYWNVMFVTLTSLGFFAVLRLTDRSKWWWVGYFFLVGFVLQTDLATAPMIVVGLFFLIKSKVWKKLKIISVCVLTFILLYWPMVIFDLNHNFSNLLLPLRIKEAIVSNQSKDVKFDPLAKMRGTFDSLGRLWYLTPGAPNADEINFGCTMLSFPYGARVDIDTYTKRTYAPAWLSIISLTLVVWFIITSIKSENKNVKILSVLLVTMLIAFFSYPGGSFEYYLLGILAFVVFIPGIFISYQTVKWQRLFLLILLIPMSLGIYTILSNSDEFSLGPKRKLISAVMNKIGDSPFRIDGSGFCHDYEGWRYLFKTYGRVPDQSYTDKNLGWLYPDEIIIRQPKYLVTLAEDRIPIDTKLIWHDKIQFGGYTAYIQQLSQ